jgi:hypothetical protein
LKFNPIGFAFGRAYWPGLPTKAGRWASKYRFKRGKKFHAAPLPNMEAKSKEDSVTLISKVTAPSAALSNAKL